MKFELDDTQGIIFLLPSIVVDTSPEDFWEISLVFAVYQVRLIFNRIKG
jgi:hypothetical protein